MSTDRHDHFDRHIQAATMSGSSGNGSSGNGAGRIIDTIRAVQERGGICYSFEYFPAKTVDGVSNLLARIEVRFRYTRVGLGWLVVGAETRGAHDPPLHKTRRHVHTHTRARAGHDVPAAANVRDAHVALGLQGRGM